MTPKKLNISVGLTYTISKVSPPRTLTLNTLPDTIMLVTSKIFSRKKMLRVMSTTWKNMSVKIYVK